MAKPDIAKTIRKVQETIMQSWATCLVGVVIWILLVWIVASDFKGGYELPKIGEVASFTVKAPYDLTFEDTIATNEDREIAESRVMDEYRTDTAAIIKSAQLTKNIFEAFQNGNREPLLFEGIELPEGLESDPDLANIAGLFEEAVNKTMASRIREEDVQKSREQAFRLVASSIAKKYYGFAKSLIEKAVTENQIVDAEATQRNKQMARDSVIPINRQIKKGEVIVEDGHVLTREVEQALKAYGFYNRKSNFIRTFFGAALMLTFFFIISAVYLHKFVPAALEDESSLLMIEVIVAVMVIFVKIGALLVNKDITIDQFSQVPIFSIYAIPIAAASMLISVLINSQFAILMTVIISSMGGIITESMDFFIISVFAGIVAVYIVLDLKHRGDFIQAGTFIGLSNIFLIVAFSLMKRDVHDVKTMTVLVRDIAWGGFNGILSSVLAMGFLPYAENMFRVSSVLKLMELADVNQPLLRELSMSAPGTYNHSIIVGNLSEAAASVVGANPLLCRVGGYYHDIGKLKRPYFFIENQTTSENVHDGFTANLSATIISAHVKDGVQIAKEHSLPEEIIDIIKEHHGTTLIKYFYQKARENSTDEDVNEMKFSYPGPKPQNKVSAIVMLADCIESAVRVMPEKTPGKIQKLVKKIIEDKQEEKQLNESDLTMKNFEDISNCFLKVFNGMYHKRIEYPEMEKDKKEPRPAVS